jgi:hypothetical protein
MESNSSISCSRPSESSIKCLRVCRSQLSSVSGSSSFALSSVASKEMSELYETDSVHTFVGSVAKHVVVGCGRSSLKINPEIIGCRVDQVDEVRY